MLTSEKAETLREQIQEKLQAFQGMTVGMRGFIPSLESLISDLAQHFNKVEMSDLPALDNALSTAESKSLARAFSRIKLFVPSRSHSTSPNVLRFNTVASLISAPIDYLSDLLRKLPDKTALVENATLIGPD